MGPNNTRAHSWISRRTSHGPNDPHIMTQIVQTCLLDKLPPLLSCSLPPSSLVPSTPPLSRIQSESPGMSCREARLHEMTSLWPCRSCVNSFLAIAPPPRSIVQSEPDMANQEGTSNSRFSGLKLCPSMVSWIWTHRQGDVW